MGEEGHALGSLKMPSMPSSSADDQHHHHTQAELQQGEEGAGVGEPLLPLQEDQEPVQPQWFTPLRLLLIFCVTNLFVYLDRGLIASNGVNGSARSQAQPQGSGIQGEFDLTFFQDGLLSPAFLVGLLIAAPLFAEASKSHSAFRLLGVGMGVWALACLGCGLAPNYAALMACRALVGVGEASFVSLAAPFIDDYAPPAHKATWFAAFFLCIPVGFASGYITGGLVGPSLGWRAAFWLEAAAMLPFVAFALLAQPIQLKGGGVPKVAPVEDEGGEPTWRHHLRAFWTDVRLVARQPVWFLACAAYTLYVAVLGVYAYWGPKAGRELFFGEDSKGEEADLVFGAITVITGVMGTIGGGLLLDYTGSTLQWACIICGASSLLGLFALIPAFLATKTFGAFMAAFAVGQLLLFLLQAPVVAIQMWSVPALLRPLGASLTTCTIHLLGDVPSPPLLGLLQAKLSEGLDPATAAQQWRLSLSAVSLLLLVSALLFLAAGYVAVPGADFRGEGGAAPAARGRGRYGDPGEVSVQSAALLSSPDEWAEGGEGGGGALGPSHFAREGGGLPGIPGEGGGGEGAPV